jgi:broad specificity phosphatase PhoE
MSILLIRHEEPELRGSFIGRTDSPLTAAGRDAAAAKHFRQQYGEILTCDA